MYHYEIANRRKGIKTMTTITLMNWLKAAYNIKSDYQLAKKLNVKPQTISRYMLGQSFLDDKMSFEVAELLELEPALIVACVNLERAERQGDAKLIEFWEQYAEKIPRPRQNGDTPKASKAA